MLVGTRAETRLLRTLASEEGEKALVEVGKLGSSTLLSIGGLLEKPLSKPREFSQVTKEALAVL